MNPPPDPEGEEAVWNAFIHAAVEWAKYLDQFDKFQFKTEYGPVYVSMTRETQWPDSYDKIDATRL